MNVLVSTLCAADDRKTLAVVRSLAAHGARVYVAGDQFHGQAYWSRFAAGRVRLPHPVEDEAGYARQLIQAARDLRLDVVIPTRVATTQALANRAAELEPYIRFAVPSPESQRIAANKLLTIRRAEQAGVRVPRTECPGSAEDLERVAEQLSYPAAIKPVRGEGGIGFWAAPSRRELLARWRDPQPEAGEPDWGQILIQEFIPGPIYDACALFRDGEPVVVLTQKRLAVYPLSGGVGAICETTDDPELAEAAVRVLKALKWHGPAQVEFKRDARNGEFVLLEVNGRLWGTADLAIRAGVDFPWCLCLLASGETIPGQPFPNNTYRKGLRYRWPFPYGVLSVAASSNRWRTLRDFFAPAPNTVSDLRWDDPLPPLAEGIYTLRRLLQRRSWRPARG